MTEKIGDLPERRYAVIVDEAHSSQGGRDGDGTEGRAGRRSDQGRSQAKSRGRRACPTTRKKSSRRWPSAAGSRTSASSPSPPRRSTRRWRSSASPGAGRQAAALPPLHHAAGHRGGLHPRRAEELHDLQDLLPADQVHRGRPAGGQDARRPGRWPGS